MLFFIRHDTTANDIGMPIQVFRRRVDDDIDTVLEWTLAVGREERIVGDGDRACRLRDLADRGQIDDVQQRIAGRFDPDAFGLRRHRLANVFGVAHADEDEVETHVPEDGIEESVGAPVNVVSGDDLIARLKEVHRRGDRGHSSTGGATIESSFQRGNVFLERSSSWIATSGVIESSMRVEIVPAKCGRGIDRSGCAVESGIFIDANMDAPGLKLHGNDPSEIQWRKWTNIVRGWQHPDNRVSQHRSMQLQVYRVFVEPTQAGVSGISQGEANTVGGAVYEAR